MASLTALLACAAAPAARAAPPLSWTPPSAIASGVDASAVSCPSQSLCVAVDAQGDAFVTSDAGAGSPSWSRAEIDQAGAPLSAVSCAGPSFCVAVDEHGDAFASTDPAASSWSAAMPIDEGRALTGVSCPTSSLCVAVDAGGGVLASASPASGGWTRTQVDAEALAGVSCATAALCVAVDGGGDALASGEPANGHSWKAQRVAFAALLGVSCASPQASPAGAAALCAAIDSSGDVLASEDPLASPATWSVTPVEDGARLASVSCAASGVCVAVDDHGRAIASDHPAAAMPAWASTTIDSAPLTGVSCLEGGFCLAVDESGRSLSAQVPAPKAETLEPAEVTSSSALLRAKVAPNDAAMTTCRFEYGSGGATGAYGQSIPCSALPTATGGEQVVSAPLAGLAPNTAYRYRVVAASPAGTGSGGEAVFTTATTPLVAVVTPRPSIAGIPAVGQRLACQPGTPAGVSLAYAWLRDQIPIASAKGSTYTVAGQDSGHHLQCQVTATDAGGSATADSAFVTIPVGGVPASAGETQVGAGRYGGGRVKVPIACSARASGGCEVTLRLRAVETLSGRRVVALAARAKRAARGSAARLRRLTVTLASARVHIRTGARATVTLSLNSTARRLLAARRRFTAYLYVSGTVIGVLEAQLARQLLTLSVAARGANLHASHRATHARRAR